MADFAGALLPPTLEYGSDTVLGYELRAADVDEAFSLVAFAPLNQELVQATETTLVLDMSLTAETLDPDEVTIQIEGVTIYASGSFTEAYEDSTVVDQGGGVYRFTIESSAPWPTATVQEVRVFPPGESP